MTDRIDLGSFDRASLSPSDYAALKSRVARQAHAERSRAIYAAFAWLVRRTLGLQQPPFERPISVAPCRLVHRARMS
ncbi:hypothetical protein BH10PSE11_BH10PSE11_17560 [soil metagenome]